jgi:hypothetical protein
VIARIKPLQLQSSLPQSRSTQQKNKQELNNQTSQQTTAVISMDADSGIASDIHC